MKLATNSALGAFFLFLASGLLPGTWGARTELSGTRHSDASGFGFSPGGNGILVDNLVGVSDVYTIHMKFRVDEAPNNYIRLFKFILDDHSILSEDPFDVDDQIEFRVSSCTGTLLLWDQNFDYHRLQTGDHHIDTCTFEVVISRDVNNDVRIYLDGKQGERTEQGKRAKSAYVDYFTDSYEKYIIRNETILLFEDNTIGDFTNDEGTGSLLFFEVYNEAMTPAELCVTDLVVNRGAGVLVKGESLQQEQYIEANGSGVSDHASLSLDGRGKLHVKQNGIRSYTTVPKDTSSNVKRAELDDSGDLIIKHGDVTRWNANIANGFAAAVFDFGNFIVYDDTCQAIWSSHWSCELDTDCLDGKHCSNGVCCAPGKYEFEGKCVQNEEQSDCLSSLSDRGAGLFVQGETLKAYQGIASESTQAKFQMYWQGDILTEHNGSESWRPWVDNQNRNSINDQVVIDDETGEFLVEEEPHGKKTWTSGVTGGFVAAIHDFGNLILYNGTCQAIWSSHWTCGQNNDCLDGTCDNGVCQDLSSTEMVVNMFESTDDVTVSISQSADSVTLVKESGDSSQYSYVTANTTALQVNFIAANDNKYQKIYFLDQKIVLGLFPNGILWWGWGAGTYAKGDKFTVEGRVGSSSVNVTRRSANGTLEETFNLDFPDTSTIPADGFDVELAFHEVGSSFEEVVFLSP